VCNERYLILKETVLFVLRDIRSAIITSRLGFFFGGRGTGI
jgi:hypothetical protein